MRLALAQIDPTVGGFRENLGTILELAAQAAREGADLVAFPELALTGYPPLDLLENRDFLASAAKALEELIERSAPLPLDIVAGAVVPSEDPSAGKGFSNAAVHLRGGKVLAVHRKVLLPSYDVFDETRHFAPGRSLTPSQAAGERFLLSICEDVWNDKTFWARPQYQADPVEEAFSGGGDPPTLLLNLSASPYSQGKATLRLQMLGNTARRHRVAVAYVNCVGGNDSLVFDGRSLLLDREGRPVAVAPGFTPRLLLADTGAAGSPGPAPEVDGDGSLFSALVTGLRGYARKCGFSTAVLGLSGGVDSSLTAAIAAEALGPERVLGVLLPSPFTSEASVEDALALGRNLGLPTRTVPISGVFSAYLRDLADPLGGLPGDATEENLQARIRGNILMALSNRFGHLLLTTGNKSELATGYCTLYGDMSGGLAVISDLLKGEVYRLSRWVNREREVIPLRVLTRAPSAELRPGQTDQDSLPPYEVLDAILRRYIEEHQTRAEIAAAGFDPALVGEILNRVEGNEYKRQQAAPGLKVSWKAFGLGRRYPIAKARLFL